MPLREGFSEVGKKVIATSIKRNFSPEDAEGMLVQLVDGTMFAGLLGTGHLTQKTIERIRKDVPTQGALWEKNKDAYLLESARVDPPVTSVTAVLGDSRTFDVASGTSGSGKAKVTLEKGSTMQLVISSANIDPNVFGGPTRSVERAREFDPSRDKEELDKILSWNGVHGKLGSPMAPRGCLGHHLSIE